MDHAIIFIAGSKTMVERLKITSLTVDEETGENQRGVRIAMRSTHVINEFIEGTPLPESGKTA